MKKLFELLPHTADIKLRVYGDSIEDLFKNTLVGMFQSIKPYAQNCSYENNLLVCPRLDRAHSITITSTAYDLLLVDFLSQAWYLSDVHNEAYLDVIIKGLVPYSIDAVVLGVGIDGFEVVEIKAVTYHELVVEQLDDGSWYADIIFDI